MRRYTFAVVIHEGDDEFWETQPTDREVTTLLIEALEAYGLMIQHPGGYPHAVDTVRLVRMDDTDDEAASHGI